MPHPHPKRAAANAFGVILRRAERRVRYIAANPGTNDAKPIYAEMLSQVYDELRRAHTALTSALWNTQDVNLGANLLPIQHEVIRYLEGNPELAIELIEHMRSERNG